MAKQGVVSVTLCDLCDSVVKERMFTTETRRVHGGTEKIIRRLTQISADDVHVMTWIASAEVLGYGTNQLAIALTTSLTQPSPRGRVRETPHLLSQAVL